MILSMLLEKTKEAGRRFIKVRGLTIDLTEKRVLENEEEIRVSPVEFFLLRYLAINKGKEVSTDQLLTYLWKKDVFLLEESIERIMDILRSKIGQSQPAQQYIAINNKSYKLLEV
ncbi:MAG: winged helix-turn-helix domain-containing protein [Nitrospirota bacterium]|jgi:OmpR-family two-component system manganese-sensing response regulator